MNGLKKGDWIATDRRQGMKDMSYVFGTRNVIEVMCRSEDSQSHILVYRRYYPSMNELRGFYVELRGVKPRIVDSSQNRREFFIRDKILQEVARGL